MDAVQSFLFEDLDIRGAIVHLGNTWIKIQHKRDYPVAVRAMLGQMSAVTTIIAANLKTPGRITFQLSGHGAVRLMVIDCSESLNLRGYAKCEGPIRAGSVAELMGDGRLLLTLDTEQAAQPYQSYVPLEGETIADVFEHYLRQSEQTPARLILAANGDTAAALFLQKLPGAELKDMDGWERVTQLAATLKDEELLGLPVETLLTRLFHEESVRVFEPRPVTHDFPPDWEKVRSTLRALGREELESILAEHGEILVRDDLSNHEYHFDAAAVEALLDEPPHKMH
ncbi:Hsp33 family molecular chaperone HslO [Niveibacterium sp. SC-1]|uniref:Hsp33 family molecular chaperone HslO n=1 Tax=Niveibacterium sp. SC-1 TaxID=3135646 RepID=UPI00311EF041